MKILTMSESFIKETNKKFQIPNDANVSQIKDILLQKRIYVQNYIISQILTHSNGRMFIIESYTGSGKTYMGKYLCEKFEKKFNNSKYYVVTPFLEIEIEWKEVFDNVDFDFSTFILKSYTQKEKKYQCDVLIIDEVHKASNTDSSLFYSKVAEITDSKVKIGLTATLNDKLRDNLYKLGFETFFQFTIEQGYALGFVPEYYIFNISVSLTEIEKLQYVEIQSKIDEIYKKYSFSKKTGDNVLDDIHLFFIGLLTYEKKPNSIYKFKMIEKTFKEWLDYLSFHIESSVDFIKLDMYNLVKLYHKRGNVLEHSHKKMEYVEKIIKFFKDEQVLFFSKNTIDCDVIESRVDTVKSYHNKIKPKELMNILNGFKKGNVLHIASVGKAVMGLNNPNCKIAIQTSFNSSSIDFSQKLGRIARQNFNDLKKPAYFFNLYIDNFKFITEQQEIIHVYSKEKSTLNQMQKGQNKKRIFFFNDVDSCLNKIKNENSKIWC